MAPSLGLHKKDNYNFSGAALYSISFFADCQDEYHGLESPKVCVLNSLIIMYRECPQELLNRENSPNSTKLNETLILKSQHAHLRKWWFYQFLALIACIGMNEELRRKELKNRRSSYYKII